MKPADPKDHLANERTFLAWIRTCIGIMAFGFLFERVSLLLQEINPSLKQDNSHSFYQNYASYFGIFLIIVGSILSLLALINYRIVTKQIDNHLYRPSMLLNTILTIVVLVIGLFLIFLNI